MGIKWGLEDGSVDFWFLIEMITIELIIIFDLIWFDLIWFEKWNKWRAVIIEDERAMKAMWQRWMESASREQAAEGARWPKMNKATLCARLRLHLISFDFVRVFWLAACVNFFEVDWVNWWTLFSRLCVCVFVIWLGWWMLRCYLLRVKPVSFSWPTAVWFNENLDSLSLRIRLELPWRFPVLLLFQMGFSLFYIWKTRGQRIQSNWINSLN